MFKSEQEYYDFLAWALNGSCLPQRMQESALGAEPWPIPSYWHRIKKHADKMPMDARQAPRKLFVEGVFE